jgi:hypothetical protein
MPVDRVSLVQIEGVLLFNIRVWPEGGCKVNALFNHFKKTIVLHEVVLSDLEASFLVAWIDIRLNVGALVDRGATTPAFGHPAELTHPERRVFTFVVLSGQDARLSSSNPCRSDGKAFARLLCEA